MITTYQVSVISLHIFTTAILPPQSSNHPPHRIQTDATEFYFSKVFTEYLKIIQHQKLTKSKFNFVNWFFFIIYNYVSTLETKEKLYESPPQSSRHAKMRRKLSLCLQFLDSVCAKLTDSETSQIKKLIYKEI